ncbi:MAG TPA: FAD:protein FMN transferase [Gammaproteobacteria bacterium]|nr:FAD:protein FMN transferase [Gammaproteobacteria bacterium]
MACPCEVLLDTEDEAAARRGAEAVAGEAWRIERTFSRYRDDNIVHAINHAADKAVRVDEETARLLDFAAKAFELSDGLFDITSGALRRVWKFDGSDRLPEPASVREVLKLVGWGKLRWRAPEISMPAGLEIDFGGIGKEYAVDRAATLGAAAAGAPLLVNFGGDIYATALRRDGQPWQVAIETLGGAAPPKIELKRGGVTTSGDARRYLLKDGVRYGHILDPRNGWPVKDAPRSVTVLEANCTQAGLLSTLAILQGAGAEKFLQKHKVAHWVIR